MSILWFDILVLFLLCDAKIRMVNGIGDLSEIDNRKCHPDLMEELSDQLLLTCDINSELNKTVTDLEELKNDLGKTRPSIEVLKSQLETHIQALRDHGALLRTHATEHRHPQSVEGVGQGPRDCSDISAMGFTVSGVYRVYPGIDNKRIQTDVYCDLNPLKESWLVFQRRKDGSENFDRIYSDYERGFGNLTGEFWLGNFVLNLLTANRKYRLRVELEDFEGEKRYAEYSTFHVNSSEEFYRLTLRGYFGNAGDNLHNHNGAMFSAKDVDKDKWVYSCAQQYHSGWWFMRCHASNLNGLYLGGPHKLWGDGIAWNSWHGMNYSLKATEMKIAPATT